MTSGVPPDRRHPPPCPTPSPAAFARSRSLLKHLAFPSNRFLSPARIMVGGPRWPASRHLERRPHQIFGLGLQNGNCRVLAPPQRSRSGNQVLQVQEVSYVGLTDNAT